MYAAGSGLVPGLAMKAPMTVAIAVRIPTPIVTNKSDLWRLRSSDAGWLMPDRIAMTVE